MDEIVGTIVEQIALRARDAAARKAAAIPAIRRIRPPASAPRAVAPAPVAPPVARAPVPPSDAPPPLPALDAADPFGSVVAAGPAGAASVVTPGADVLLGAFSGGSPFLAAFVLSEALSLPVALREPKLP